MPAPKRPTVFALILLLVSGVVTACGIEEDPFACRDFCDKYRNCDPSLSDEEWDACHLDCENTGFTSRMVDCVLAAPLRRWIRRNCGSLLDRPDRGRHRSTKSITIQHHYSKTDQAKGRSRNSAAITPRCLSCRTLMPLFLSNM